MHASSGFLGLVCKRDLAWKVMAEIKREVKQEDPSF